MTQNHVNTIAKLLEDFRTKPGLMRPADLVEIKAWLTNLSAALEIYARCPAWQGTALNSVLCDIEKADWYIEWNNA